MSQFKPELSHSVSEADFKINCLMLMDTVIKEHTEIIITHDGYPIAKLIPFEEEETPPAGFGVMKGTFTIIGDIMNTPP